MACDQPPGERQTGVRSDGDQRWHVAGRLDDAALDQRKLRQRSTSGAAMAGSLSPSASVRSEKQDPAAASAGWLQNGFGKSSEGSALGAREAGRRHLECADETIGSKRHCAVGHVGMAGGEISWRRVNSLMLSSTPNQPPPPAFADRCTGSRPGMGDVGGAAFGRDAAKRAVRLRWRCRSFAARIHPRTARTLPESGARPCRPNKSRCHKLQRIVIRAQASCRSIETTGTRRRLNRTGRWKE